MARPTEELALAWQSLSGNTLDSGWRTIPVQSAGPCMISAGRRFPGNQETLLFRFPAVAVPPTALLPEGQGFAVERVDPAGDGSSWLALSRQASGSLEMFTAMASDIGGALDGEAAASGDQAKLLRTLLRRIGGWQDFMAKGSGALGPEQEIGLIGELLTLRKIIDAGVPVAIACESWVGPRDGLRDFEIGTGGIEVKSTLSAMGFKARVGSLAQLDDTARQPLFVAAVRLRLSADGMALPQHVEALRDVVRGEGDAQRLLGESLLGAGYLDLHAERYTRRFAERGSRVLEVGEGFPRLTPSRVPPGITWATYELDLDTVPGPSLGIAEALRRLGAI